MILCCSIGVRILKKIFGKNIQYSNGLVILFLEMKIEKCKTLKCPYTNFGF